MFFIGLAVQQANVLDIPVQYLSAIDLASKLSIEGARVEADGTLSNRLYLIAVHKLSLERFAKVANETLGLEFRKRADGSFLMAANAARTQSEHASERAFVGYYQDRFDKLSQACNEIVPDMTPDSLAGSEEKIDAGGQGDDVHRWAAQLLMMAKNGDINAPQVLEIERGLNATELFERDLVQSGSQPEYEMRLGPAWRAAHSLDQFYTSSTRMLPIPEVEKERLARIAWQHTFTARRLFFDPITGLLAEQLGISFRPDVGSGATRTQVLIPDPVQIKAPDLDLFGSSDEVSSLKMRREKTASTLATLSDSTKTPAGSVATSEAAYVWAQAHPDQNLVMEVSVVRDRSPERFLSGGEFETSLRKEFTPKAAVIDTAYLGDLPSFKERLYIQFLTHDPTYTVQMVGGILAIRDEFAFVDHHFKFPGGAVAHFEETKFRNLQKVGDFAPNMDDLLAFCRATSPEEDGLLSRFYSAHVPNGVTSAYPFFRTANNTRLVSGLAEKSSEPGQWSISVQEVGDFDTARFAEDLQGVSRLSDAAVIQKAWGLAISLHPDLARYVRESTIEFEVKASGASRSLSIQILHPKALLFPIVLKDGTMRNTPLEDDSVKLLQWPAIDLSISSDKNH